MADHAAMFRGPAEIYDRFIGRYSPGLALAMCEAAGVREGQRALDVGCGSGALAAKLAEIVGAENVAGIDPSEPFVEATRARVPGARILVGSAESIPFANREFDATLSQLVVNFLTDPDQGLREMWRVTQPGGTVAGCVWRGRTPRLSTPRRRRRFATSSGTASAGLRAPSRFRPARGARSGMFD